MYHAGQLAEAAGQAAPRRQRPGRTPEPSDPEGAAGSLPEHTWIVVAAYNEAARIGPVLDALLDLACDVVVVDDGSADATVEEVGRRPVWLARHAVNLGQGAALQTGICFALSRGARYVVTFDADGQHDPADVSVLVRTLIAAPADFALGSRFLGRTEGMPPVRRVVLRAARWFTWLFSGVTLTDTHNGIRAMTRRGAQQLRITLNRMEHASEVIDQIVASGLPYVEVPVRIRYSAESLAKGQRNMAAVRLGLKLLVERVVK